MSWRDNLRPGSFRGVGFKTAASDAEFGRRTAQHEYPLRDTPYAEDLGRKQRAFTIEAFVIGDDYLTLRDKLIEACEQPGPGQLVHPYYGTKQVTCTACRVSETTSDGRIARFVLSFAEAGERIFPAASGDFLSRLGIAGDGIFSSAGSWFEGVFSVARLPQQFIDRAVAQVQALGGRLQAVRGIADTAAGFYRSAHRLVNDAVALVQRPAELVSGIIGTVGSIADLRFDWGSISTAYGSLTGLTGSALAAIPYTPEDAAGRVEVAGQFFDFGPETEPAFMPTPAGPAVTVARRQEQQNTAAIAALVQLTAVAVAAIAAGEVEYDSLDDALAQRSVITSKIDALMATEDDAVYQALAALRTAFVQAVPTPGEDLPNLVEIVNLETRPSLALAYSLYDSLEREGDIVRRNRIEHPGFVPGGPLKVIRNG